MPIISENVCGIDRAVRIVIGMVIIASGILRLLGGGIWGYIIILIGIAVFLTGLLQRCGLYVLFGFNSCPDVEKPNSTSVNPDIEPYSDSEKISP